MLSGPIEGVLIDIAGVLHVSGSPVAGAVEAIGRLNEAGVPQRYVTNTTRTTRKQVLDRLRQLGFEIDADSLFTAPTAALRYLRENELRPFLLIHPDLRDDFSGIDTESPNAVVVGDAGDEFHYGNLNRGFRVLMEGGELIGMGANRYFRQGDELSLDQGPFVEALRYASGVEPVICGKPAADFFEQALEDMQVDAPRAVMIGDDLESDVGGAQRQGIQGVLVRTGKFQASDESHESIRPDFIADDITEAIEKILEHDEA